MKREPEKVRAQATARSKAYYHRNLDECRRKGRETAKARHAADPALKRRNKLKSDYGMTPEQWQAMFEAQGRKCAICGSEHPNAKPGWNTDHCHKTGRVRFILCAHCNRGLGAFRDNPEIMRKAADMLEAIQDKRVETRHD
jgi:DNA repair exonuclease SbcCD ATPase subunit